MTRKTRQDGDATWSSEEELLAIRERAAREAKERAAELRDDLMTLKAGAELLGVDESQLLELAFSERLDLATILQSGRPIFLRQEDVHRFIADPETRLVVNDLEILHTEPRRLEGGTRTSVFMLKPEPNSPISRRTLRVLRSDILRTKENLRAAHRSQGTLHIDLRTQQVFYKGHEVIVKWTAFRLLVALAESPETPIPHDKLVKIVSAQVGKAKGSYSRWAKDHKLGLMTSLRKLAGHDGITRQEVDQLISAPMRSLKLNLPADQVIIDR
jgi:hypothetical protein